MADVSRHVSALLGNAMHISDMSDYYYIGAYLDRIDARSCAIDAIQADDLASGLYAELQRATDTGPTDTTQQPATTGNALRLPIPLADVVHHVKPSVTAFSGNRSADPDYITDGVVLIRTDAIRTTGRARRLLARTNQLDRRATTEQLQQVITDATRGRLAPLVFLGLDPTLTDDDKPKKYQRGPTAVFTNDDGATEVHYSARYISLLLDYIGPDAVQLWVPTCADPYRPDANLYPNSGPAVVYPVGVNIKGPFAVPPVALLMPYRR
jgi:hypothetical protein